MSDVLGSMWLVALLVFLATTAISLGFLVRRQPAEQSVPDEDQAAEPDDRASS